jgi:large subunit ribosomal protein L24
MKIKKGDKVKMLSGKDRDKTGKVVKTRESKISVEGLNLVKKNIRPKKQGEKGQTITFPRFVSVSTAMLICPNCGAAARVGYKFTDKGTKQRFCKKCKQNI